MYPLVVLKSFGKEKASDIIKQILCANDDSILQPMSMNLDSYDFTAYKLSISTKYYTTSVLLFECDDLNLIPNDLKSEIEGCIFYFDANDMSFLSKVKTLVKFVNDNNIGVSTLITRNLKEDCLDTISYDEIKNVCKLDFNVVDLNEQSDNEEAVGYAEVLEILKNHIWPNVHIPTQNSNSDYNSDENDVNVEEALNEFEDLLNKFNQFKSASQNMCREEVLQNAENLAQLFANILNED